MTEIKKIATRESYGNALAELGELHEDIVVLDADLSGSTKTAVFGKKFPERFVNCGIQECNVMGMAAGFAASGMVPFASSFAMFAAGRAYEIVRNSIAYSGLNVKICASHAGISVGEDGASHQCLEDIGLMKMLPGMTVMQPADDVEARAMVKAAYEHVGPVYIRVSRLAAPVINPEDYAFQWGKGVTFREGKDLTIVATGLLVAAALEAADRLKEEGIDAGVINIHTIKPIDEELLVEAAKKTGRILTAEEHSVIGGMGDTVCSVLAEKCPVRVKKLGVFDRFGESGPAKELMHKYGLDADGVYAAAKEML